MKHIAIVLAALCLASAVQAGGWGSAPALNTPRYGAAAATLDGKIYVVGGTSAAGYPLAGVEVYDPAVGSWDATAVPPLPAAYSDGAAIALDGRLFFLGGVDDEAEVDDEVYSWAPGESDWMEEDDMRRKRRGHRAMIVANRICVMGGIGENGVYETEIEYRASDGEWEQAGSTIVAPRAYPFVGAVNDTVYLFGGIFNVPESSGHRGVFGAGWTFAWSTVASLAEARGNGAAIATADSIYMLGGITASGTASDRLEVFAPGSGALRTGPSLPTARIAPAAAELDGRIYLIGGYATTPGQPLASVDYYDPTLTAIEPGERTIPESFVTLLGYPNPFNGVVQLRVRMPRGDRATLAIYDIRGRKIRDLHSGFLPAGEFTATWDARADNGKVVASGVYLAVLRGTDFTRRFRVVYVR